MAEASCRVFEERKMVKMMATVVKRVPLWHPIFVNLLLELKRGDLRLKIELDLRMRMLSVFICVYIGMVSWVCSNSNEFF